MSLNSYIDQTNLNTNLHRKDIDKLIKTAIQYRFKGLCIDPGWVVHAKQKLVGTGIQVVTVPNWGVGKGLRQLNELSCKAADEVDYIWDVMSFVMKSPKDRDYQTVEEEFKQIRNKVPKVLKIIVECSFMRLSCKRDKVSYKGLLSDICQLVQKSKADWIKTDSGLFKRPDFKILDKTSTMTVPPIENLYEDVRLMKQFCKLPIKAAGGIRTKVEVEELIHYGAKRIGTSQGVEIVMEK